MTVPELIVLKDERQAKRQRQGGSLCFSVTWCKWVISPARQFPLGYPTFPKTKTVFGAGMVFPIGWCARIGTATAADFRSREPSYLIRLAFQANLTHGYACGSARIRT